MGTIRKDFRYKVVKKVNELDLGLHVVLIDVHKIKVQLVAHSKHESSPNDIEVYKQLTNIDCDIRRRHTCFSDFCKYSCCRKKLYESEYKKLLSLYWVDQVQYPVTKNQVFSHT